MSPIAAPPPNNNNKHHFTVKRENVKFYTPIMQVCDSSDTAVITAFQPFVFIHRGTYVYTEYFNKLIWGKHLKTGFNVHLSLLFFYPLKCEVYG